MSRILELIRGKSRTAPVKLMEDSIATRPGWTAVVFDSPHSGTQYPADFGHACDLRILRRSEDTHVEKLFGFAPDLGIAWQEALFPRSYVDVNRAEEEVDTGMIEGAWPGPAASDPALLEKVRLGKGLFWSITDDGVPIYARKLRPEEAAARIDTCWRPYHAELAGAIAAAHARHGWSIHVNCHSMPSVAGSHATLHPGMPHPDFVLGDRDGTTCSPGLTSAIAAFLRARGYSVDVNRPYKGVEIVRRYANPAAQRHSIQLEVNRKLYMDEATLEMHVGSGPLRDHLRELALMLVQLRPGDWL